MLFSKPDVVLLISSKLKQHFFFALLRSSIAVGFSAPHKPTTTDAGSNPSGVEFVTR